MRPGGESDKFGNRYEGCWSTCKLLEVLNGRAEAIEFEPLEEGLGIEFILTRNDHVREFHSVKVQTTKTTWTVYLLAAKTANGRSILGDLLQKLAGDARAEARFLSESGANPLHLLCQDAELSSELPTFRARMDGQRADDFAKYILPLCQQNADTGLGYLKRLRVVSFSLPELIDMVEREIFRSLYRLDGDPIDAQSVRRLLGEWIIGSSGMRLDRPTLLARLKDHGYGEANWPRNPDVQARIAERNQSYRRSVRGMLINGVAIHRTEAADAFDFLQKTSGSFGAFVGVAGLGKSCAMAELVDFLDGGRIPCLALRLDSPFTALTPHQLGRDLGFPMSPIDMLAAVAQGGRCILVLDQLDALSIVSGRNAKLWSLVEDLLAQVDGYSNMKVWLGCRAFDLEHDVRLRKMVEKRKVKKIDLRLLTAGEAIAQIQAAALDPASLGSIQIDLLRTPMHLSLYLEGAPAGLPPFRTVLDLYDRYWDRKQDQVRDRLGRAPAWAEVIDLLCGRLSVEQTLSVRDDLFDGAYREDARVMASENVLVMEDGLCRFFHEGFFDYAFARGFVRRGDRLADFLLRGGEQHLFRRSQVRQILSYMRSRGGAAYLAELNAVLVTPGIRGHIVKVVFDWLAVLPDPTAEELKILGLV